MLLVLYLERLYPFYCCPPWFWSLPTSLQGFSPSHRQTPGTWRWAAELWWVAGCDLGPAGGVHLLLFATNHFLTPYEGAPSLLVPEAGKQQASVYSHTIDSPAAGSISAWVTVIYCSAAAGSERASVPRPFLTATQAPPVTNLHRQEEEGSGGRTFLYCICYKWAKSVCFSFFFPSLFLLPHFFCRGWKSWADLSQREKERDHNAAAGWARPRQDQWRAFHVEWGKGLINQEGDPWIYIAPSWTFCTLPWDALYHGPPKRLHGPSLPWVLTAGLFGDAKLEGCQIYCDFVTLHCPQGELLYLEGVVNAIYFFPEVKKQGAVALQVEITAGLCKVTSTGHLICC